MSFILKKIPSVKEAEELLKEAEGMNPGPWYNHSLYSGYAAEIIAKNCSNLDPDTARVMGMLHDVGRRAGWTAMRHIIDGYNYMMEKGYDDVAKVCLTHSFNCRSMGTVFGKWDCSEDEYNFVKKYIESVEYDDYDLLIQLCDVLTLPDGFCLMEKRMIDVAMRHGIHDRILKKWDASFKTKEYFEKKIGTSIYKLLPGVIENTFDF